MFLYVFNKWTIMGEDKIKTKVICLKLVFLVSTLNIMGIIVGRKETWLVSKAMQ